jgi:hypothetical protein
LEDNIKMDLKEIGCEGVDRIQLAQPLGGSWKHSNEKLIYNRILFIIFYCAAQRWLRCLVATSKVHNHNHNTDAIAVQ